MVIRDKVQCHNHPATCPNDTLALSVDQLGPGQPNVKWNSAALNAGWLSPTGYYSVPEAWSHTSSDTSGGGPCRNATSVALAANVARTRAVAILRTVPDGEGVAASLPLQYGIHRPWVHTVDAEVILYLLRHADHEQTTGVPAGAAKRVNQMPQKWLQDGPRVRGQHTEHPFWFAQATSNHSDALLHKADWAASRDTFLQNMPPGPGHAQLIVAGSYGHLELPPPTTRRRIQGTRPWARPTPQPTSTPGISPRRPATTVRCGPGTTTRRCNADSESGRSGSLASPSSQSHASSAPIRGYSGPTTGRWYKKPPATSRPEQGAVGRLEALRRRRVDRGFPF